MSPNQLMVERAKEIILRDCIDIICIPPSRIYRYLRSKKRKVESDYIYGAEGSDLHINTAVKIALNELAEKGQITRVGSMFRRNSKNIN